VDSLIKNLYFIAIYIL